MRTWLLRGSHIPSELGHILGPAEKAGSRLKLYYPVSAITLRKSLTFVAVATVTLE